MRKDLINMIGQTFERLTVKEYGGSDGKSTMWVCKCICGTITKPIRRGSLTRGHTTSCGCFQKETNHRLHFKGGPTRNEYERQKSKSAVRGYEWSLSQEQFEVLIFNNCSYCGKSPFKKTKNGVKNGIDRVNNNMGYKIDNCVTCCKICNIMKQTLTVEDFFNHIKQILKHKGISDD